MLGYGGGGHDGAYLTDSMVVVIFNPGKRTMTLLSIPRDSWVPMSIDGKTTDYGKINSAYALARNESYYPNRLPNYTGANGAGNFAKDTVSQITGIPVSGYFGLDFAGFRDMIDAVGGIDVDVPDSFSAQYPANDDPSIDASWKTVSFTAGTEHMDGERAIEFARAREAIDNLSEGTDFARSNRQRIIMQAFKSRLLQPTGLIHLPQVLGIISQHADTDFSITNIGSLGQYLLDGLEMLDFRDVKVYQAALTPGNYLAEGTGPQGTYVLVPDMANQSWAQVRAFGRQLWQDQAAGTAMANTQVVVENDSGQDGLAGHVTQVLAALGYNVGPPVTGEVQAESSLVDQTGGQTAALQGLLKKDLGIQLQQPPDATQSGNDQVVLKIGTNDVSLANMPIPEDNQAPSSAEGVQVAGY